MRMLHLIPYYIRADKTGGPAVYLNNLAQSIVDCGIDVTIVTTNGNLSDEVAVDFTGEFCKVDEAGIPTIYLHRKKTFLPPTFYYAPALPGWLNDNLYHYDIVIVHGIWTYFGWAARMACQKVGKPYLLFVHGSLDGWALKYHGYKKLPYWHLVEKYNFQGSSGVLALCRDEEAQIRAMGIQKPVGIIPHSLVFPLSMLDEPRQQLAKNWPELSEKPFVYFMSRLHPKKGLDILLAAWKHVCHCYPGWRLVIAGPDEDGYQSKLLEQVKTLSIQDTVIFTGLVTGDIKTALLQSAALFVLPSYSEGVPLAVIEALGYSLPVLITTDCHLPEVAKAGAGLIILPETDSIIVNLDRLMADASLRQVMGQRAQKLVRERFNPEEISKNFLHFCQSVLQSFPIV
jgi:glycosyltransferase involved in cell wall biosynthesis